MNVEKFKHTLEDFLQTISERTNAVICLSTIANGYKNYLKRTQGENNIYAKLLEKELDLLNEQAKPSEGLMTHVKTEIASGFLAPLYLLQLQKMELTATRISRLLIDMCMDTFDDYLNGFCGLGDSEEVWDHIKRFYL